MIRRARPGMLAVGTLATLLAAVAVRPPAGHAARAGSPPESSAPVAAPTPRGRSSACRGGVTGTLASGPVRQCEQARVRVALDTACSWCPGGLNVVVIEMSRADEHQWMRDSAFRVADELTRWTQFERPDFPVRLGVVHYDARWAVVRARLTEWLPSARMQLAQVGPAGGDPAQLQGLLGSAVGQARSLIRDERRRQNVGDDDQACDYALVYAEGSTEYPLQGQNMVSGVRNLYSDGVDVFVGCPSRNPDWCVYPRLMPRSRGEYAEPPDTGALARMFRWAFRDYEKDYVLREVSLAQHLTNTLAYVAGSASVAPDTVVTDAVGTTLTWRWERLRATGAHSVTYAVQPQAVGDLPVGGEMALWDAVGRRGRFAMSTVAVSVTGLCATLTPSPTLTPLPTATATASTTPPHTATPGVTPSAPASATPRPASLYLPLTIRERCDPERRKADVVLVLDTSRSMTGAKLAGAQRAARAFVSQLSLGRDRAAVVAFDDAARVVLPLSADRLALEAAIDSLTTAPGTRIDLGLEAALTVLAAGGTDPLRTRVIVVLTDGRQVVEPERAEAQAASARAAGVLIYTIGLGTDVDGPFLVGLAGDQQRYFFAPGEAELVGIYQQIAVDIPCPQSSFWPRRR